VIDDSGEDTDEEYIVDHTGTKRKAFKYMF